MLLGRTDGTKKQPGGILLEIINHDFKNDITKYDAPCEGTPKNVE